MVRRWYVTAADTHVGATRPVVGLDIMHAGYILSLSYFRSG